MLVYEYLSSVGLADNVPVRFMYDLRLLVFFLAGFLGCFSLTSEYISCELRIPVYDYERRCSK